MGSNLAIWGGLAVSQVDGPGSRVVLHTAGCSVGCRGCFNPHTHDQAAPGVTWWPPSELARQVYDVAVATGAKGVTISGGEPTDQMEALVTLLRHLRQRGFDSIVLFSGRKVEYLRAHRGFAQSVEQESLVDVLIDGPYMESKPEAEWNRGSANQRILPLTSRHEVEEFRSREVEIKVDTDGRVVLLGFPDQEMLDAVSGKESV